MTLLQWSLFGVEMSPWMWLLLVVSAGGLIVLRSAREGGEPNRLESLSWGLTLALTTYVAWLSYSASDAVSLFSWLASGTGRVWLGIAFVSWAGYVWQQSAGEVDNRRDMVDTLRERVTGPILAVGGIISTILITAVVGISTLGLVVGDLIGFILGVFGAEPGFGAAVLTGIGGWISAGGTVPLVDPFIPGWTRGVSPVGWIGFVILVLVIGLSLRSDNFRRALVGSS